MILQKFYFLWVLFQWLCKRLCLENRIAIILYPLLIKNYKNMKKDNGFKKKTYKTPSLTFFEWVRDQYSLIPDLFPIELKEKDNGVINIADF
jgi:hypothetical protein